jgi:prenyltransferase beta subunit
LGFHFELNKRVRNVSFVFLVIIIMLSITPIVLAKTRESYLVDFIYKYQNKNQSFGFNSKETANAVEIIAYYDAFGGTKSVDILKLKNYLKNEINQMFSSDTIDIYTIKYNLEALNILEPLSTALNSSLHNKIYRYINETYQVGGGFSPTNESGYANIVSTYFIYNIYSLLNEPVENKATHLNWISSCYNSDGGYGGNQTLPSTLITTNFAVYLTTQLGAISNLVNKTATLDYFKSLYIGDSNNLDNYGGYLPDLFSEVSLLGSTLLCVEGIKIIDINELNEDVISNWVLKHQNFLDGGFGDSIEGTDQKFSSIGTTYSAFKTLQSLGLLNLLNEDIFMVEFNYIILIILISVIGAIVLIAYIIQRRRRI